MNSTSIGLYDTGLHGVDQPTNLLLACQIAWAQLRQISAISTPFSDRQTYWRRPLWGWIPYLKRWLIYAPLWKHRRAAKARFFGSLPSRLHSVLLAIYIASNVGYLCVLNWSNTNKYALLAELRGRSGTLAAVNFIPLVVLAGRNNPLIGLLKISFDTYILIHRWIGKAATAPRE